ncbi:hypothetical protein EIP91_005054 [Steccherinum ochraceum]|uniref:BTB domain-containing protein n=1 Tax=Steccherinum ochraceum TaxID=92696 RepID=A0A4R0RS86_9APHY|nr:hypothetical protein EIP91_005054 [Steccherinum ochraceum]
MPPTPWSEDFKQMELADADFVVRSIQDGQAFHVKRERLEQGSNVFRAYLKIPYRGDMFACCESGYVLDTLDEDGHTLDMDESAEKLGMLFQLLHHLPEPYEETRAGFTKLQIELPTEIAIPFPLLPTLYALADKYALSDTILQVLHTHLGAYASTYPLRVYGYATTLGVDDVAACASSFLLAPPLSSYTAADVKVVPSAPAYHRLVQLHDYRIKKLGELVMGEEIFPHGYGKCPRHGAKTQEVWEARKKVVGGKIQAATDVAAEMADIGKEFAGCDTCAKAANAAISMLRYKCAKVPKRVDKIPV